MYKRGGSCSRWAGDSWWGGMGHAQVWVRWAMQGWGWSGGGGSFKVIYLLTSPSRPCFDVHNIGSFQYHHTLIGLSIERPILDHHPKAHIHEIRRISPWNPWNPVDFTCEIRWISPLKSSGFHPWNLADFTQISPVKSTQNYKSKCFSKNSSVWWMQGGGFHPEIGGFHPDFTCEIHPKL